MSIELVKAVNQQVANWTVLYVKLHNYHWYIKGKNFFTLHAKFEELYNEANVHVDELAERILALEAKPVATMKEVLETSSLEEATGKENEEEMVQSVVDDFEKMVDELQEAIELAEEAKDEGTGDMLIAVKQSLKKHIWMLKAYLG
ncbi:MULTISPECIES: Dps family protein [Cytobacillus]|uniref:DNA starvation/stationary phase protection protein n=1 Tax=Cytobacillus oceanisediminis 2691 TaxID=1196031 RepID=A0A160MF98_9BACI|nr:DNA starvation/stationary phase protection protein [Cytobacillus oceanisediminis]MBY0158894.1 DNA starvation/stationary phase protection protein [Cytobacillus firmus]AND41876.1 DNA starvation/stationary phase protection protein [Cytobacillus oceanisediminis 2691]MCM3246630.1 DNA starvation/stationary phase protection protein [Cytobacillus oceanisediminis]MCM3530108.1 DNA starvation/stationary phase protection protein [Cytobacillus oceanisediminis]MCS0827701.1 DNA starvation/stationary phase